jgi:pyridoxine/pyridoxamine 5'-phosphate oxidase
MIEPRKPEAAAQQIVDSNRYMTIGTADERGLPWVSPVWFAEARHREFFWVSAPGARHSRNIALRPQVSIVIFDSQVAPNSGEAVYMAALAGEVTGAELERGMGIFSARSEEQGLGPWTAADAGPGARLRLYRATASEQFVLGDHDERVPVDLGW